MTQDQRDKLTKLARCSFFPGSIDKKFVRNLNAAPDDYVLSERQAAFLDKLTHKYRRQLGAR